ncbi:MAG: nucleotidyltransferase family protein [Anaerolineales bacterium]|nr:nucleotidyltransferase family protein [Anaerolineales bacterium]
MDCVITAGGLPTPEDPLYAYTKGSSKALLDMGGRTMLERVVDALQASKHVGEIVVVGLGSNMGMTFQRPVHHVPDQGSLIGNVIAGIRFLQKQNPETKLVMLSSADIPAITPAIVNAFIESCRPHDRAIYYNFVDKPTMDGRFPGSNRTFVKLKGTEIAGGDMLLVDAALADSHTDLWQALTEGRKHAWKLARVVGLGFLIKFLFHRVGLADIEATAERIIGKPVQVVLSPFAELAMDADKPHQVDLLQREFA